MRMLRNRIFSISGREKLGFFLIVFILFTTYPFVFNRVLPLPSITIVMLLSFLVFFLAIALRKVIVVRPILPVAIILTIGTIVSMLMTADVAYYKQVLYIWWGVVMLSFIEMIGLKKFLFLYNRMILLIAFFGVVSFVLFAVLGDRSFLEFEEMDGRAGWLTYFTFTNTKNGIFIRYAGVFDEPGAMATWGMFSLLLNKVYVKDEKLEIPLIVCLLFTFSIAYLLQLALYWLFFYFRNTSITTKLFALLFIFIVLGSFWVFVDKDTQIYLWTFGRLGIGSSTNFMEENNRVQMMEEAKAMFYTHPVFGVGTTRFYAGEYAADNPYETLAKDGIVGTFFLYYPLIKAISFAKRHRELLYMIIILAVGYLQRPFHINILHYTMLFLVFIAFYKIYATNKK